MISNRTRMEGNELRAKPTRRQKENINSFTGRGGEREREREREREIERERERERDQRGNARLPKRPSPLLD